uniref:Retrotransposon protein, putative, Ty1-copia subclass n=2 Tax=Oryza sativa subsp. japonica TaxID=39947 RepID=Q8SAV4_ORYSJ|nr:Putative polyprotein [Oryza sativa]AAP52406.1 retrotransposon protein, putative, Ty1-copia subclass [Oryza sativa Japonica Group]
MEVEVENQLDRKIKRLRSNCGGEFFSNKFDLFCEEHGIIHERTPPYSPESNGIAEINEADKCVYYRYGGGEGVILYLYVDDILIVGTNFEVINEVKSFLSKIFDMKDLGVADVILNIKLIRVENEITLLQSHYVEKILNRFGYIDSKPSPTPYDPSLLLRKDKRNARNQLENS